MNKIHVICQQPLQERYTTEWYMRMIKIKDFNVLGYGAAPKIDRSKSYNYFANLEGSIWYENDQLNKLMRERHVENLLITDLDFPGLAIHAVPLIKLKFPKVKIFGIYHAGSWCNGDIFSNDMFFYVFQPFCMATSETITNSHIFYKMNVFIKLGNF